MRSRPRSIATIVLALAVCVAPGSVAPAGATAATAAATSATAAPRAAPPAHGGPPAAATSAIVPGSVDRTSLDLRTAYDVELKLNYTRRTLSAVSTMLVTNESGGPVDRLELNAVAARLGRLAISSLTVDGVAVSPTIADQTLMVPLGGILPDGASASVRIAFRATARKTLTASNWLFTRTSGALQLYRWLPWISRATPFDRPNHGDPFVTVSSPSVRVRITTDRALRLATSGRRIATDGLTSTWLAENVRDFNVVASPSWAVWSRKVGPVLVRVYGFRGGNGPRLLSLAVRAMRRYQALMGPYPYPTFVVAETGGGSGMESPGLIWIPRGLGAGQLPWLVSHETAHQWFYSLVGNDQARQPFADEAMADFLARYLTGTQRASRCATATLDRSIYRYSKACYFETVYVQGGRVLDALRKRMGGTRFWAGIRDYLATNRFGLGGTKLLLDTLDAHTPLDLVGPIRPRFPGIL
ncbi:MAG TPA: hypothetical protein VLR93_07980 [Patescibacteria group bacterium]|nr:hypothetical protein [Patescibacteria group bacterium]